MRTARLVRYVPSLPALPIAEWVRVSAERRALAALPAERLKDIGLTEAERRREVARPFWDLPRGR